MVDETTQQEVPQQAEPDSMAGAMAAAMVAGDDAKADELVKAELQAVASGGKVADAEGGLSDPPAEVDSGFGHLLYTWLNVAAAAILATPENIH